MVYVILGAGFEEAEAIIPCDLLRRAGLDVKFAGIGALSVTGSHGITVTADCIVEDTDLTRADMIVLPGGLGGVTSIRKSRETIQAVRQMYNEGKYVAAICAAPTVLASLGITDGKRAVCYPGMEAEMGSARMQPGSAVTDGTVITGRSAGTAFDFALELIRVLRGEDAAQKVASGIVYKQEV